MLSAHTPKKVGRVGDESSEKQAGKPNTLFIYGLFEIAALCNHSCI